MEIAQKYSDRLPELKEAVHSWNQFFKKNNDRYKEFMQFVFETSLTQEDITKLQALNKPTIEFNVLEAIINRFRGEFVRQEPEIMVRAEDGLPIERLTPEFLATQKFLESHLRIIFTDSTSDGLQYKIFTDLLGGGFSMGEIYTDYLNDLSFDQKIHVQRVFDPTMCGFDPLARLSHKGDGRFCFQLFPKKKEDFIAEYGKEAVEDIKFTRTLGDFNWSYAQQKEDILLVCDFYEKKKKREKIVKLTNGHVTLKKHYEDLLKDFNEQGFIEQPPQIMSERWSEIEKIVRYRFCESRVLEYVETNYTMLPIVFIDGNSVDIKNYNNGSMMQMTRPYAYHAKGIQKLKNFAGQTVASEIENMVQHKFKVSVEAIPEDYQEAYRNVQQADVLVYNAFHQNDPQIPLAPPMEIQRTPTPPIVESIFLGSDRVTQAILGAYDAVLGNNQQDISGIGIANGAIQSTTSSTPYLTGYIHGINRLAQIVVDLIPKYYVTPRTLPVIEPDGKRAFRKVYNGLWQKRDYKVMDQGTNPEQPMQLSPEQMQMEGANPQQMMQRSEEPNAQDSFVDIGYKSHELNVRVEAGVNSVIQKQVALDQIIRMMQASPLFAQFINTEGLETLLDNMDIRGIESMKASASKFMKQMKEQQQQQSQQPDPMQELAQGTLQIEQAKVEQQHDKAEGELSIAAAKLAIEKQKVDIQAMKMLNDIEMNSTKMAIEQEKMDSENARTAVETAIELTKHHLEEHRRQNPEVEVELEGSKE